MRAHHFLFAGPLVILLAASLEALILRRLRGRYNWREYFASAGDLLLRALLALLPLSLAAASLNALWPYRLYTMPMDSAWVLALLFVGQDFCYYWMHRADHRVRFLWATHSVHHSPTELNLSAAYRLGWTARLSVGPLFFAPLVLIGFHPLVVATALALNLLYQFWLHADWIPRLGPLEWILNTPSHHRVHHGSNPEYLDRNFGGVFIVFDRLLGTFTAEDGRIRTRFGLTHPIDSHNPLVIGTHEWRALLRDLRAARSLREALGAAFGPPRRRQLTRRAGSVAHADAELEDVLVTVQGRDHERGRRRREYQQEGHGRP